MDEPPDRVKANVHRTQANVDRTQENVEITQANLDRTQANVGDVNTAPRTTAAEDLVTAGQRKINLIWESMQALIAGLVVATTLFVSMRLALASLGPDVTETQAATANTAFLLLSNLASLVIGFYFGRQNHQKIGGVQAGDTGR